MRYRPIPHTSLQPSVLCLGTSGYGTHIPAERAWQLLDTFAELGGNFVDTARIYGAWAPRGLGASERVLGAWLRSRGMRDQMIVVSKGGHPELSSMDRSRLSPGELHADVMASLADLQTDFIDLYFLHRDDPAIPVGEILDALAPHVRAGRIRALGASNWHWQRLAAAATYARQQGLAGFAVSQIGWSLATPADPPGPGMRYMDAETFAYHVQTDLPLMAYSSQAQGFFAGKYEGQRHRPVQPGDPPAARLYAHPDNFARLDQARLLARRHGRSPNEIALGYLLSQPFPVYPIVGCRTVEQIQASCNAASVQLGADEIAYLRGDKSA